MANLLRGLTIGLSVIGQPLALVGQTVPVHTKEDLASYQTAMQPRTLETYRGSWEDMGYSLPLGVDTNSAIKLELCYLGGMIQREFIFKGNSSSGGPVTLNSCSGDLGTMPALVVGKQGNK